MIFLDVWQPGEIKEKDGPYAVLTMLQGMCGFTGTAFVPQMIIAETPADATFSTFFGHFGLQRLIIIDLRSIQNSHRESRHPS
jgi:hypothetical protein